MVKFSRQQQRSLQTWTNAQVFNLAAMDMLRCVCDCPILVILLLDSWPSAGTHHNFCDIQMAIQVASFSFACSVELSTLARISAERYLGVARPFHRNAKRWQITISISEVLFCPLVKGSPLAMERPNIQGAVCILPSNASRERKSHKKESKMAKRAGYIIIPFLVVWLPLVTTILINGINFATMQEVEIMSVSIACITSLSNPIMYAAVNPHFRTGFYQLKTMLTFSALCR
ncbi:uncharacterized protein LOC144180891 [Stigmatopora nigra]